MPVAANPPPKLRHRLEYCRKAKSTLKKYRDNTMQIVASLSPESSSGGASGSASLLACVGGF